jgi:hypothetical protein
MNMRNRNNGQASGFDGSGRSEVGDGSAAQSPPNISQGRAPTGPVSKAPGSPRPRRSSLPKPAVSEGRSDPTSGIAAGQTSARAPSANGGNGPENAVAAGGRDERGRFGPGNPGGPGNPFAAAAGRWRAALVASITEEDLVAGVRAMVNAAKRGESWAVREMLDRTLGKPVEADLIERLERLEAGTGTLYVSNSPQ